MKKIWSEDYKNRHIKIEAFVSKPMDREVVFVECNIYKPGSSKSEYWFDSIIGKPVFGGNKRWKIKVDREIEYLKFKATTQIDEDIRMNELTNGLTDSLLWTD
ncbi:hypothetical protein QGM71_01175 [Virgibacillus sp. C22-A2]|uniref:Uncharacterized protein n=1 Tax=Virgibacillus tibetensis TaxID=3042313 RepID=A0ABU6KCB4_9BACI|nr:hypothetical protein [Virgibacillus sp. C22-A2]